MSGLEATLSTTMVKFCKRLALVTSLLLKKKKSFYITSRVAIQLANLLLSSRNVKYLIMQIHKCTPDSDAAPIEIMASR
jgi:hypothetical protein